jgi:hypothetical protein
MLGLRKKLTEGPFLKAHWLDGKAFVEPPVPTEFDLRPHG